MQGSREAGSWFVLMEVESVNIEGCFELPLRAI